MSPVYRKRLVLSLCLVLYLVASVSGLQCLECEEVYDPDDCSLIGTCGRGEICFTRRVLNFRDRPAYRLGCEEKDVCEFYKQTQSHLIVGRDASDAPCRQCCEDNFCNSMLCKATPTQTTWSAQNATVTELPTVSLASSTPAPVTRLSTVQSTSTAGISVQATIGSGMRDCDEYQANGLNTSGVYEVNPDGLSPFNVYCYFASSSENWLDIQHRYNGSVDFHRDWDSYKHGFGSVNGEFWLGNEYLHRLTSVPGKHYTLWFDLIMENGTTYYARYYNFTVGPESDGYRVNFTKYQGNAGDSFRDHQGMQFSTADHDNDSGTQNCAQLYQGGWWYHKCYEVNINGVYGSLGDIGLIWVDLTGWTGSLKETMMSIGSQ